MTDPRDEPSAVRQIREAALGHELRGYARKDVDALLDRLAATVAVVEAEREDFRVRLSKALEGRSERETHLAATSARQQELEQQLQRMTEEHDSLVRSFDETSRERESLLAGFDEVKREREETLAYAERIERELIRLRDLESSLTQALVAAERSGNDLRAQAQREAELILEEARAEARKISHQAAAERERLVGDVRGIRAMLESALATLNERRLSDASAQDQRLDHESGERRFGSGRQDVGS